MRRACLLLMCGLLSAAAAQDARSLALLAGLTARAPADAEPLRTFDYTLRYTIYSDTTAKAAENYVRFAVDVGRRRLYTDLVVGNTLNSRLSYQNGRATASDLRSGETFVPPEALLEPFMSWFAQVAQPDIRAHDLARARYRGQQDYGEVVLYRGDDRVLGTVRGEEVEVTAALPDVLGTSLGRVPVRLIFGPGGEHLASVYRVAGEPQLVRYDDPTDPAPLPRYLRAHLYRVEAGELHLEARIRLEALTLNRPLDERLFRAREP